MRPGSNNFGYGYLIIIIFILQFFTIAVAEKRHPGYKPEELVCEMHPGYSIDIVNNLFETTVKGYQPQTDCYLLMTRPGQDAESLAVVISELPEVLYCGANYYLYAPEPFQRSQPFLEDQGTITFEIQAAAETLDLSTALTIADGSGVKVAVIDGGVNIDHEVFTLRPGGVYYGWDYVDNDPIANDEPGGACSGHGTFVTGVIKLTAPATEIYCYRVLDTLGQGNGFDIADAILKAIEDGCRIINLSLGMQGVHDAIDEALRYAEHNNIIVVAAAGNDNTDDNLLFPFPASRAYCLAVAALDSLNLKADFSNYGLKIDFSAPGTRILSPFLGDYYAWWDGTSFSTPFVTGQVALIRSINPLMSGDEVTDIMATTSINIDDLNPDYVGLLGAGLIDPVASLAATFPSILGDLDNSETIDILDVVYLINYIYKEGPAPYPLMSANVDCDENINILDIVYLINFLYKDGPSPCLAF